MRAVATALSQVGVDLEVIVVDDGSADQTTARLSEVADARLRVLRLRTPQGGARARNLGISEARGQWIAFLDDDDVWSPKKLNLQLRWPGRCRRASSTRGPFTSTSPGG